MATNPQVLPSYKEGSRFYMKLVLALASLTIFGFAVDLAFGRAHSATLPGAHPVTASGVKVDRS